MVGDILICMASGSVIYKDSFESDETQVNKFLWKHEEVKFQATNKDHSVYHLFMRIRCVSQADWSNPPMSILVNIPFLQPDPMPERSTTYVSSYSATYHPCEKHQFLVPAAQCLTPFMEQLGPQLVELDLHGRSTALASAWDFVCASDDIPDYVSDFLCLALGPDHPKTVPVLLPCPHLEDFYHGKEITPGIGVFMVSRTGEWGNEHQRYLHTDPVCVNNLFRSWVTIGNRKDESKMICFFFSLRSLNGDINLPPGLDKRLQFVKRGYTHPAGPPATGPGSYGNNIGSQNTVLSPGISDAVIQPGGKTMTSDPVKELATTNVSNSSQPALPVPHCYVTGTFKNWTPLKVIRENGCEEQTSLETIVSSEKEQYKTPNSRLVALLKKKG
jgi:hypothetical protein